MLFSATRNVVLNFQELYETQVGANTNLIEKNKRSYLLAQEAEEDKEEEKRDLGQRLTAYTLKFLHYKISSMFCSKKVNDPWFRR